MGRFGMSRQAPAGKQSLKTKLGVKTWLAISLAGLLAIGGGCESASDDLTGGETHFLRRCDPNADSCGRLSCVCGVCTVPCSEHSTCHAFPAAQCAVARGASCDKGEAMVCRVACAIDDDCLVVSPEHRCDEGTCVAGDDLGSGGGSSGGAPSTSGGSSAGGASGGSTGGSEASGGSAGEPDSCARGEVEANDVLVLGDSFLATNHQVTAYLEELARQAGVLKSGDRYRDSSRIVANSLVVTGNGVLDQYTEAASDAPVKVALMNGGGADILIGSCDEIGPDCPVIKDAAAEFVTILEAMADDGVLQIVFLGYPDPVPEAPRAKMDALRPLLESACAESEVPCHWLDLRPVFEGHYDEYIEGDGLNPTAAGAEATAHALWELMERECIAQ